MATGEYSDAESASTLRYDDSVPLRRIFLATNNPRFEPVESEQDAIDRLCEREDVLPLAKDIARRGLNPLERFALTVIGESEGETAYYVEEGNRRVCALKLLNDPDRAPAKMRAQFEKLAEGYRSIQEVPSVVFASMEELRVWLDRVHSGPQDGIGRKSWNSEQKQRFYGGLKNALAQAVLDYAEEQKMLTKDERSRKLTTAQRFLNNEILQETIGIDKFNIDGLSRTRPKKDFDVLLRRFIRDLVAGEAVTSRMNKPDIIKYARSIADMPGVTAARVNPSPLVDVSKPQTAPPQRTAPTKPAKLRHLQHNLDIEDQLSKLGNQKLISLYYSITSIEIEKHTPLVCVGAWAFLEALTATIGRDSQTSFNSFLSKNRLPALGVGGDTRSLRHALDRVNEFGNSTKHHPVAATFNAVQLANDLATAKPAILACIAVAIRDGDKTLAEPEQG